MTSGQVNYLRAGLRSSYERWYLLDHALDVAKANTADLDNRLRVIRAQVHIRQTAYITDEEYQTAIDAVLWPVVLEHERVTCGPHS